MTETPPLDQPVFIVGPLRSGTTLLRLMLQNHPRMNFFGEFEGAVSQAKEDSFPNINDYHQFVANDRMMQDSHFEVDSNLNYIELVKTFLKQKYLTKPSEVIGACVHSRFDLITKVWPNARFIHITRDPRDVAKSTIPMGWAGNVYGGSKFWVEPEQRWQKLKQNLNNEAYIEVKYETLIRSTEQVLTKICLFLGQQYNGNMPNIDKVSTYAKPDANLVEQWRKKQSAKEVLWVESQCREMMKLLGYEPINTTCDQDPSSISKFILQIDNKVKKIKFSIKRYGYYLWLYKAINNRFSFFKNEEATNEINEIERIYLK
ncbi:hypothetical protein A9Q74_09585 [Colwellia sp. 39_35_sub15_T18]|nr:hypothetical protein A9Q74_09585 [Colwellia sp. 39_35_sub15_T18]